MIIYPQSTGHVSREGYVVASGYSGYEAGLYNPVMQGVKDVGPIPRGKYTLREVKDKAELKRLKLGPRIFYCEPEGTDWLKGKPYWAATTDWMFGRFAFYIHWDNAHFDFSASHGCIVLLAAWMFDRMVDGEGMVVVQ